MTAEWVLKEKICPVCLTGSIGEKIQTLQGTESD